MDEVKAIEEIGRKLHELRIEKDVSLEDVARETGVSKSLLSRYERGLVDPGLRALSKLTKYYGVSLDWLFGFAKDRTPINTDNPLEGLPVQKQLEVIAFIEFIKNRE